MEESDPEWKINIHDPEFCTARKVAVKTIGQQAEEPVNMECSYCADRESDFADAKERKIAVVDEKESTTKQDEAPGHSKRGVGFPQCSVEFPHQSHIVAQRGRHIEGMMLNLCVMFWNASAVKRNSETYWLKGWPAA